MTLVGIARGAEFEVFTHPWRIRSLAAAAPSPDVAPLADGAVRSSVPPSEAARVA